MNLFFYLKRTIQSWWMLVFSRRPVGSIAVLVKVWGHHAKFSGYRPVADGLGLPLHRDRLRFTPLSIVRPVRTPRLHRAHQIALAMKLTNRDKLLVIDGDSELNLYEDWRQVSSAGIFAVFHQVPEYLEKRVARLRPGLLDGVICVARCQIPYIESLAPRGRSWFIPHGVNTDYFCPFPSLSKYPSVICVGHNYRDIETLRTSADIIKRAFPTASVKLIAAPSILPKELDLGSVELLSGLSDEALRDAYRQAWVVLLPLTDATANNSLLEGLACGTPVVISDVGGISDYTNPECGALCPPGDAHAHAEAVIDLLRDSSKREAVGHMARLKAETFAWPIVRAQISHVLGASSEQEIIE